METIDNSSNVIWKGMTHDVHSYVSNSSESLRSMNVGSVQARSVSVNDAGITVPGSISEQKFQAVSGFPLEAEKHVIVLKLLGETEQGTPVVQAVTVKTKQKCPTCGHVNKATAKFCTECGTGLQIV